MKIRRFIFSMIVLATGEVGFAQSPLWTQMPGSPSGNTRHDDIVFANETNGWSARGLGGIFKTTDGGNTWSQKLNKPNTHFRAIGFLSPMRGFAGNLGVGSYDANVTDTNVLYQTEDGGETWTVTPGIAEAGMKGFCAIYVLDSQHIYGGGRVRGPAHFAKSEDGGTNWTVIDLKSAGIMGGIMDVYFKDPLNGFVVGMDTNTFFGGCGGNYHGRIAKTTDGGTTWTAVADTGLACTYFWKMSWPTADVGYVSLQHNGAASSLIFYKTIDGGSSWVSNGIPFSEIGVTSFFLQGIGFVSATEGWAGGASATAPYANNFLHTTDGGASWKPAGYNDSRSINRVRVYPNFAIASGGKLHIYKVPLLISAQPQSQTNEIGSTVTLNAVAQGTAPLTYQWQFGATNLLNATTNSYSITNFQSTNAGGYSVVVSDFSGAVTSAIATLTVAGSAAPPIITTQPFSQTVAQNSDVVFAVSAAGAEPLVFQWRFNGENISGATQTSYTRTNVQSADAGTYLVVVTNSVGSVTSSVATLTILQTNILFANDFDGYGSPITVTNVGTTNGYRFFYRASTGPVDFKAIFGFDYSTVTVPTTIPSAPHSVGGGTKGLFLTANKDATTNLAAVNLYPTGHVFSGNFALKFDMWINWANPSTSTEHAMFGINHSGNVTNRVTQTPSDGLFFEVSGEGGSAINATTVRDFSVLRGGGAGAPILMTTNNTVFGPAPLLGPQFDDTNPGFISLFPSRTIPNFGDTPAGTGGLRWVSVEVRQKNQLVSWIMNGTTIAQYTNTFAYTNGTILLGYNDQFTSIGDSNNFVIFDNLRVEPIVSVPVTLVSPSIVGNGFSFNFATETLENYFVEGTTNLNAGSWTVYTNFVGTGNVTNVVVPLLGGSEYYFRVRQP